MEIKYPDSTKKDIYTRIVASYLELVCFEQFAVTKKVQSLLKSSLELIAELCGSLKEDAEIREASQFVAKYLFVHLDVLISSSRYDLATDILAKYEPYFKNLEGTDEIKHKIYAHFIECGLSGSFSTIDLKQVINDCVLAGLKLDLKSYLKLIEMMVQEFKTTCADSENFYNADELFKKVMLSIG